MICTQCRRPIRKSEAARAHVIKDEKGRVVETLHNKCKHIREKRARMGEGGRRSAESPTAYAAALRYRNRDDLSETEQERVRLAEARYTELIGRVKAGEASAEERVELDHLAVARDGTTLDFEAIELSGAEQKAAQANRERQQDRLSEDVPERWDDWRMEGTENSPQE